MSRNEELEAAIEAILFASTEPVSRPRLEQVFERQGPEAVGEALDRVVERFAVDPDARGIVVEEVAGGVRVVTRPELHGHLRAYFDVSGQNRLSMAALETLAIVAYRQPVTGPEIQDLRGVNSSGVLKTLLDRRLIRIAGRKLVVGKPFMYRTTREFLMHFGLAGLRDLPPLEEFEESFGSLDPDLLEPGDEMLPGMDEEEADLTVLSEADGEGESGSEGPLEGNAEESADAEVVALDPASIDPVPTAAAVVAEFEPRSESTGPDSQGPDFEGPASEASAFEAPDAEPRDRDEDGAGQVLEPDGGEWVDASERADDPDSVS